MTLHIAFQIDYNKLPPNHQKTPRITFHQSQENMSSAKVKKNATLIIHIISGNKIYQELMEHRSKSFNFRQIFRNRSNTKDSDSYERNNKARAETSFGKIEELEEAERRYKLNVKIIEDSQNSKRFSKLTAQKRIKTEPTEERISPQPSSPTKKEANSVSIKKIDFYDNNQVQDLNKRLHTLISDKLTKLSKMLKYKQPDTSTPEPDSNFYNDLNDLIRNIKRIKNKQGSNEISFLNKKIEYIESLMAENTTELELIRKYYYYCNSNKKRGGFGRFMSEGPRIFKAIRANEINRTSPIFSDSHSPKNRPFFGVASNKEQYKPPKKEFYQLQRTKQQSYSFNDQPLPRSSYKRDFLNINAIPLESTKIKEDRHHSPNYTTTFKTRYTLDYKPLKTQTIDYRELDAYHDKLKFLEISYPNPQSVPLKAQPKILPSLSKESQSAELLKINASVSKQQRCFDKHRFVTESQKSYGWQMLNERSRIKHKQLREFQYRLKNLFKS